MPGYLVPFGLGLISAVVLITLLLRTITDPVFRAWPTPGPDTWQHAVFWTSFRLLNVCAIALACVGPNGALGLTDELRGAGLVLLTVSISLYLHACLSLGRDNTYCRRDGLVTEGIYRWTRNPQYSTIIPAYAGLAVAADGAATYLLCALLSVVYVLMALAEEPWLTTAYGSDYDSYRSRVPRFFNWRRARLWCSVGIRQFKRQLQFRLSREWR
jgi:protein-S-isoprenylcysteine O-methyltransferase Ste14